MGLRFFANVNVIFFSQVANRAMAFLIAVVLARGLGPDARGDYALFVLSTALAASLGSLGISLGTTYFVSKGKHEVTVLLGNSHFLVLAMGALIAAILAGVGLGIEPKAFVEGRSYWLYVFAVPLGLEFVLATAVLVGKERFMALNLSLLSQTLVLTVGATVLWIGGWMTIFSVLAVWVFSYALASLLALASVGLGELSLRRTLRPDLMVLREQIQFGLPGQAGNILTRLNYRLDQYVVRAFRSRADVGFYAVATGLAEAVWWISNAVSMALMPRLARMKAERAGELAPIACRNTLLASLVAGAGLAAVAPLVVEPLFGSEFGPAVTPIFWLLPGIIALSGTKVLASYFFSQARLTIVSLVALISLAATLAFDFLLIPRFGISGAAAASSIAYSVSFVTALYFYRQISGNSAWSCVFPQMADVHLYVDLGRRLRSLRVSNGPAGVEEAGVQASQRGGGH